MDLFADKFVETEEMKQRFLVEGFFILTQEKKEYLNYEEMLDELVYSISGFGSFSRKIELRLFFNPPKTGFVGRNILKYFFSGEKIKKEEVISILLLAKISPKNKNSFVSTKLIKTMEKFYGLDKNNTYSLDGIITENKRTFSNIPLKITDMEDASFFIGQDILLQVRKKYNSVISNYI